ncbi:MAG: peptidoglycan DD-metalloendopeptidase family protein [Desulfonatronovibrio sp.]
MTNPLASHGASQLEQSREVNSTLEMQRLRQRLEGGKDEKKELREACVQFEAIFIQKMWEQMRATVPKEGYLHSDEQEMFESMFDQEVSKEMAESGGIGLADMLYDQLKERLENSGANAASGSSSSLNPLPTRQNFPENIPSQSDDEKNLDNAEINRILNLDISAEKKMDFLASQIEYSFGGKPIEDVPELEDKVEEVDTQSEQKDEDLPALHWPVTGRVSSDFGWRDDPFTGEQAWHAGLDFAVPEGTPVEACWPGKVIFSGTHAGFGNKVIVEHDGGWKSVYAHNSENKVKVGDRVDAGQEIALSGNTGRSTGPHLHFELRQGDLAWNPRMIEEQLLAGMSIGRAGDQDRT